MAHSNARRNERNLIRTDFQYNYTKDSFKGVDFSSPDGRCDDEHFAYLVNLYRDKAKADGAALESVPGYRMIKKDFAHIGEIYGLYSHAFSEGGVKKTYLLVHKGEYLYSFLHDRRDLFESLTPIATLSGNRSFGFAYGGVFYILDGKKILAVKSPTEAFVLGDSFLTEEEKEAGKLPESSAYIPLTHRDGAAWEARNMLTGFFDLERSVKADTLPDETQGLYYRECYVGNTRGLEVCGMEAGRRIVAIPATFVFDGEQLPVLAVAANAFEGRDITTAVLAPSVRVIGASAFQNCRSLERVLIHGGAEIKARAFNGCSALETFAIKNTAVWVDATAFEGCTTLSHVYFEASKAAGWLDGLQETASFHPNTRFYWEEQGKTLYIPCSTSGEESLAFIYGAEMSPLQNMSFYYNMKTDGSDLTEGISATASKSCAVAQYVIQGSDVNSISRYVFVSVFAPGGKINTRDEVEGFRVALPEHTARVASVFLDGKEMKTTPDDNGVYYAAEFSRGILTSLRVVLPKNRDRDLTVTVRCYAEQGEVAGHDTRCLYDAIRACRFAAVFDGRVFLGGNPDLPDTVFYSVSPKRAGNSLMFAPSAYLACQDTAGAVLAFMVHPLYLAIVKDRSVYGVTQKNENGALHELYEINGWCSSPAYRCGTYTFGDEPLYLSERGVMALKPGKAWEEGRIENRSYYIDGMLRSVWDDNAAFAEWNGYLALLIDGKIFLADRSIAEKKNGILAYEWYFLDGIGHYDGQKRRYHHLSYDPVVQDKRLTSLTLSGKPLLVLGREEPVSGEVYSAVVAGILLYYTLGEDGRYYLVDSYGERAGGIFSPATRLLSAEDCLYFSSADGYLFCFNTDKRGKSVLVNETLQSVASDEIHESYYSFDGRKYSSRLITGNVDMGVPHLWKSTVPRSLVVRAKAMPHSAFTVSVRCDGGPWEDVSYVVANELDYPDADRFVFAPEDTVSETLADSTRGWLSKQVMISAEVFESPIGIEALAYRYKMAGRAKSKTR